MNSLANLAKNITGASSGKRKAARRPRGDRSAVATVTGLTKIASVLNIILLCILPIASANAQLYTGSVTGVITDPQGAAIASATITLEDQEKGFSYTAKTNNEGRYLLRQIPPGTYRIQATSDGFQTQRKDGVKLEVNQNVSIDFSLQVGGTTVVVDVQAQGALLGTEDAVTGQVVNRKFINDLPLI